jgi:hypothetical protein
MADERNAASRMCATFGAGHCRNHANGPGKLKLFVIELNAFCWQKLESVLPEWF